LKLKKYEGLTEKEAMLKVKDDLGKEALIVSVKNIKPKGFYKIFKKPYVEVTAAIDEKTKAGEKMNETPLTKKSAARGIDDFESLTDDNSAFVEMLKSLSATHSKKDEDNYENIKKEKRDEKKEEKQKNIISDETELIDIRNKELPFLKIVYEQLLENDLEEAYINQLMVGLGEYSYNQGITIDDIISIIYKRIVKLLSDHETIKLGHGNSPKTVAFVGPTGVGKTTTIAKIASYFRINMEKKVALITSDTYRIAAVEQLRTYANILNIPIRVVYSPTELKETIESFRDMDLILIDTAGRSPKNTEHQMELTALLDEIDEKEIFLVLSLATKYKDLVNITDVYNDIGNYKLIFTKLDETSSYGNILNVKLKTNAMLSYVTFGQNVPDDISEVNVHEIAKKILGGCE